MDNEDTIVKLANDDNVGRGKDREVPTDAVVLTVSSESHVGQSHVDSCSESDMIYCGFSSKIMAVENTVTPTNVVQSGVTDNAWIENIDVGTWPSSLTDSQRLFLVENGPRRIVDYEFPVNAHGRHFSTTFYTRKLSNGESLDRRWLVYSTENNRIYCFCCKLYACTSNRFSTDGFCDWNHTSVLIQEHETSAKHIEAHQNWLEVERRLQINQTLDKELERQISAEKVHWQNVLERLLAIVKFLAERNLAFRGTSDKLDDRNNGNFLGLVELFAGFDPVLAEHVRRIRSDEIADHYLGKNMQNEFIQLLGKAVLDKIVSIVTAAKYYSVILDCTPDVSHIEQMTVVLRCVQINGRSVDIVEHFVGYLEVEQSTGLCMTETFLKKLRDLKLPISDCRGQGYDNGANMRGSNKGVQARVLALEPQALFMPCGCHSLNLILCDMAKSSVTAITLFGTVQRIYVLFAGSTARWDTLKRHVKNLMLKPLCETRWESRVNSIKAVRYQIGDVYDALLELSETSKDPKCITEAVALAKELKSFKFLVTLVVWYDILMQINLSSKMLQSQTVDLNEAVSTLAKTNAFLVDLRNKGLGSAVASAKELAEELEMLPAEMTFPSNDEVRPRKKRNSSHTKQPTNQ